jgi:hypothetical protein
MPSLVLSYQEEIDRLYDRLLCLEAVPCPSLESRLVLEAEILLLLKKILSWYGPVNISTFGLVASNQATRLIVSCNSDLRFQTLYFHMMVQDRKNFTQSDISSLARKLGLKLEGKQQ